MSFIKRNKKKFLVGGIILGVLLLIAAITLLIYNKDDRTKDEGLSVKYVNGDTINIDNVKGKYDTTKEIIITNETDGYITFCLEWNNVSNTFKHQNNLLYTIKGTGKTAASLDKSQVPVATSKVFNQVVINAGETQTYKVNVKYIKDVNEKKSAFTGTLKVVVNGSDARAKKAQAKMQKQQKVDLKKKSQNQTQKKLDKDI